MRKVTGSIFTAAVCVGLSLSAFTLSGFANTGMQKGTMEVMEKETPKEYMADFSVAEEEVGKQPDITKYLNTIFVSETQVESLRKNTEEFLLEKYGTKISQGLTFEYQTVDFDGIKIQLSWSDNRLDYRDSVRFYVEYEVIGLQGSTLNTVINGISIINGYSIKSLDGLKNQSLKVLKNELGIDVSEGYSVYPHVSVDFDNGQQQNVMVHFEWAKDSLMVGADQLYRTSYTVGFDKVDLSKCTGKLTKVENGAVLEKLSNGPEETFTKTQQEEMIKTAKQFFEDKGIVVEDLMSRGGVARSYVFDYNGQKGMWLTFNPVEKNNSNRGYIEIFITSEFDVLGYAY